MRIDFPGQPSPSTGASVSGATVASGTAHVDSCTPSGDSITVNLSGVSNAQLLLLDVNGIQINGQSGNLRIPMHVLLGDVNGDGVVNSADATAVRNSSGQTANGGNFAFDVNLDGAVNSGDSTIVRGASGSAVPSTAAAVTYLHDRDANVTRIATPQGGYQVDLVYDDMGRLDHLNQPDIPGPAYKYTYDAASNVRARTNFATGYALDTQTSQRSDPDELNRITDRYLDAFVESSESGGSGNIFGLPGYTYHEHYTYLPGTNRITSVHRDEDGQTDTFSYYAAGELKTATFGSRNNDQVTYYPDNAGNRGASGGAVGVMDSQTGSYTYDPNGLNVYTTANSLPVQNNERHQITDYDSVQYRYLHDSQVALISRPNNTLQLAYDALGRCVARVTNGVAVEYVYDGVRPIVEVDPNQNAVLATNVYGLGIDELIARNNNGTAQYFYQNWQGSTVALMNSDGMVTEYYRYDAFGRPLFYANQTATNPVGDLIQTSQGNVSLENNRFLFTGREWIEPFKVYDYRARFYQPALGRFMSEDPMGFAAGDTNLFRYCAGDPVNR